MAAVAAPVLIDRADIHKSCKSLELLVSVLSNYTEAANALATVQKKLAKALRDAASVKGTNNVPANALMNSAGVFEALAEVDLKFAKVSDQEAENVGNELKKWFKKLMKEEKAHDERITNANAKIKQAGQTYEKKAKRKDRDALDEHSRYLAILNSIGPEMSQDKYNHTLFVTQRHTLTVSGCAASLSRLAEAEWARACESIRRFAPVIGNVGEWRALCEAGWSGPLPSDLPDIEAPESQRDKKIKDTADKAPATTRTLRLPPDALPNESESPTSPSMARPPPSIAQSSETNSAAEQGNPQPSLSRPPSPIREVEPIENVPQKKPDRPESVPLIPQTNLSSDIADPSNTSKPAASTMAVPPPAAGEARSSLTPVEEGGPSSVSSKSLDQDGAIKSETKPSYPQLLSVSSPQISSLDGSSGERGQVQRSEPTSERERDQKAPTPSPVAHKVTNVAGEAALDRRVSGESSTSNASLVAAMRDRYNTPASKPASPPPRDMPRLSQSVTDLATRYTPVDTPTSPRRAAAAERFPTFQDRYPRTTFDRDRDRDRYRIPEEVPTQDHIRHNMPPETPDRDRHRITEVVPALDRDRFDISPEVSAQNRDRHNTLQDGLMLDRERYRIPPEDPVLGRDRYRPSLEVSPDPNQYRNPPETFARERGYFVERDGERYHQPTSVATVDRNQFLRNDRARYRPRSPDKLYADELGVRDHPRRIDPLEERAIQEREAQLRERERQLEIERARLTNALDTGYGSDTGGRSPRSIHGALRLAESPTPMSSQQSLLLRPSPHDHAPNCGCERCSAQHYAASPSVSRKPEKPDPPIQLRPEKPKNWIRRMSTPVASLITPSISTKGGGSGIASMALPEEDRRIRRRSFESEREKEAMAKYGTTRR